MIERLFSIFKIGGIAVGWFHRVQPTMPILKNGMSKIYHTLSKYVVSIMNTEDVVLKIPYWRFV
jgi:hypothetical protein